MLAMRSASCTRAQSQAREWGVGAAARDSARDVRPMGLSAIEATTLDLPRTAPYRARTQEVCDDDTGERVPGSDSARVRSVSLCAIGGGASGWGGRQGTLQIGRAHV